MYTRKDALIYDCYTRFSSVDDSVKRFGNKTVMVKGQGRPSTYRISDKCSGVANKLCSWYVKLTQR